MTPFLQFIIDLVAGFLMGLSIGMWLARREILTQCRLLGGFYVGNTTVTVEKINGPDVYTTGGYLKGGQVPMHRPSSPPAIKTTSESNV